jgi:flagellar biosynthesis component FlhA
VEATLTLHLRVPEAVVARHASGATNSALAAAVDTGVSQLLRALGIPGRVRVHLGAIRADASGPDQVIHLTVDGRRVRCSAELLLVVHSYVNGTPLSPTATAPAVAAWMVEQSQRIDDPAAQDALTAFVARACVEILKLQPAVLLGPAQAAAYLQLLNAHGTGDRLASGMTSMPLETLLHPVLDMRISLANHQAIATQLAARDAGSSVDALSEDLIEALSASHVDIECEPAFLQELTAEDSRESREIFPLLRDGIFVELGLTFPPLRFVADENLKPRTFAFRLNDLTTPPLPGLEPGRLLVNDTVDRLRERAISATATVSPATGEPNAIVSADVKAQAEAMGLTTWGPLQHLVLALAEALRQRGWCLVHRGVVRKQLGELNAVFPALISAVREGASDDELTRVLRALIRERTSTRNLRAILESLIDYALIADGFVGESRGSSGSAWNDRLAFVRAGLAHQIARRAARNTNALVVYLLDSAIEQLFAAGTGANSEQEDAALRGLRDELAYLPATAQMPHLLTTIEARPALQRTVATEFPRMLVLAHEELPRGTNVMPVARIQLPA